MPHLPAALSFDLEGLTAAGEGPGLPDQVLILNSMLSPTHPSLLCQGPSSGPPSSQRQGAPLTHLHTHSFLLQP